jgi:exopolysaccharide biosynthesis protein
MDAAGRVIIMVTTGFGMGLYSLSQYLPTTDLGLVNAFNLDGGGSSMLYVAANDYQILSFDPVPAVLAVYPR